ncbi:helix-turn-helix domain-containing protein [Actinokineospora pegani]|uniref:helix-turn-helix domain-containing protein n=1 Tax=Actinokineospora pegani TaxID=2654637 RepID=UPI0012EA5FBA|nr:helix-turn-helix domain-containing protein [Actinokineospora pegani]
MTSQFSALLRQLRRQAQLTQDDLAERTGLSVRTIRRLESGDRANPQLDTVRLLADALRLEPRERARVLAVADGRLPVEPEPEPEAEPQPEPPPVVTVVPESAFERRLAEAADDLAHAVGARLGREEELRRVQDPFPLPVRWQVAPEGVMDHWANICRAAPGASATALDLAGGLADIAEVYRRVPSGRLVVLGRGGSGKSVLAARFVLDVMRDRERGATVPVVFGLGSWDPTTTAFRDWLAGQLLRDHPGLAAAGGGGTTLAAALVEAGRVLPVLDGFDELAAGLHRPALDALNATTLPLLLTSRPGEYAAVAGAAALTAAAAVRLTDLTVTDLADYLPRTARKDGGATAWDPVLAELRAHPGRPACGNLRAVLTTPLMVGLARTTYSGPAGGDPAVLLDPDRFDSQHAIEEHLLGSFIPSVYRDPDSRWDPERARGWLGYLAQHLDRLGAHDLAWWQLGGELRGRSRMAVVGALAGLVVGLLGGVLVGLLDLVLGGDGRIALLTAPGLGLAIGSAAGLAHGAGIRLGGGAFEPARVQLRARGGGRQLRARFGRRLLVGVIGGAGLGVVLGLAAAAGLEPMGLPGFGFAGGFATGAGLGALAGLGWGLMAGLEASVDIRSAVGPADLLRASRTIVLVEFLGLGLVLGLARLLIITLALGRLELVSLPLDLVLGPVIGLVVGLSISAWGQWVVFARVWLPLTGRLPWSVAAFLDDACRRGVLRQVGAVHQFRHVRLQTHLMRG